MQYIEITSHAKPAHAFNILSSNCNFQIKYLNGHSAATKWNFCNSVGNSKASTNVQHKYKYNPKTWEKKKWIKRVSYI